MIPARLTRSVFSTAAKKAGVGKTGNEATRLLGLVSSIGSLFLGPKAR